MAVSFTKEEREALGLKFLEHYQNAKGKNRMECLISASEELGGEIVEKIASKSSESLRKLCDEFLKKYKQDGTLKKIAVETKEKKLLDDLKSKTEFFKTAEEFSKIDVSNFMPKLQDKIKEVEFIKIDMRSNAGAYRLLHYGLEEVAKLARETPDDKIKLGALTLLVETPLKKINAVDPLEILQEVEEKTKQFTTTEAKQEVDGFSQLSTKDNT